MGDKGGESPAIRIEIRMNSNCVKTLMMILLEEETEREDEDKECEDNKDDLLRPHVGSGNGDLRRINRILFDEVA